jgi:class 3 adenylate cyclase
MEPTDRTNRTWLCCVVFTDIVGYSRQSTQSQHAIKEVFNYYLSESLKEVSPNDLVLLDTGDGAAICLSDPEEALFSCLTMQSAFVRDESLPNFKLEVRIGINLGSVKLIRDLNGNLNAVGDGINVAQRVMSFAAPNQILASRSFFEVASSLSDEYQRLFSYEGVRTDKHVKEHSVYALASRDQSDRPDAQPVVEIAPAPTATAPLPAVATNTGPVSLAFSPELLAKLEGKLALSIGPIAKVVVRKAARTDTHWEPLIQSLAEQIPSGKEKNEFLVFCQKIKPQS